MILVQGKRTQTSLSNDVDVHNSFQVDVYAVPGIYLGYNSSMNVNVYS